MAEEVRRVAKLFEAGDYPDKGISVGPDELNRMVKSFRGPVPVQMEHTPGPVCFGWLVEVWRRGRSLLGRLAFSPSAWNLLKESGARSLSLAIERGTLAIREVSIVARPRVPDARVLAEGEMATFTADISGAFEGEGEAMNKETDLQVLRAGGKVAPAAEDLAMALLAAPESALVRFGGGDDIPVAEVFRRFLEAQPPVVIFGETAPGGKARRGEFSEDDRRLFAALGVNEDDVARLAPGGEEE